MWNDTTREIARMIEHVAGHGISSNENDVAIKVYFFPLTGALFTQGEFKKMMMPDQLTFRHEMLDKVVQEIGERFNKLLKRLAKGTAEEKPVPPQYLSVIVYGISTTNGEHVTLLYNFSDDWTTIYRKWSVDRISN
jgi:hypothetical protein